MKQGANSSSPTPCLRTENEKPPTPKQLAAKYARALDGFCEFTGDRENPFKASDELPTQLITSVVNAIHGPPKEAFIPVIRTNNHKALEGGDEHVT